MDINEAKTLLAQAKTGFEGFKTGDGIPAEYISYAHSMAADIGAATINTADDIRTLMAKLYKLVRFDQRAQRIIDAGVEGKGGPNAPGEPIPATSIGARLVSHANAIIRVDKAFP